MLAGRVAIVTGAGQGVGKGIAAALCRQGATVVVADLDGKRAESAAAELRDGGGEAIGLKVDVSAPADVAAMAATVVSRLGRLDILVNNAGIAIKAPTIELTNEQFQKVLDVNVKGVLFCSQEAAKVMIPRGGGRIVNIASTGAHVGSPCFAAYNTSKAAVVGLTRVMAVEWAPHQIRVNSVSPGGIDTELGLELRRQDPEGWARRDRRTPLGGSARVEDVANAVVFLVGDESRFITGRDLVIDGGILTVHAGMVD